MRLATQVIFIALIAYQLEAQTDQPIGSSFQETAKLLQQRPVLWPAIGFVDRKKPTEANNREGALLARLLRQMESDYSKSPAGTLSPTQEAYYCQAGAVLYERGGYSNWHLAQVLDFRAAYSIAKRLHKTGKASAQDRVLLQGMSDRIVNASFARELVRQEVSAEEAEKLASKADRDVMVAAGRILKDHFGSYLDSQSFPIPSTEIL